MSFFMRFYSYGPDGKLDVIHKKICGDSFPLLEIGNYMAERTGVNYEFSRNMLYDLDVVLNIIEDGVSEIPGKRGWSLERDHIFPQSYLVQKEFPNDLINSVGNLRLINKTRNILKSDKLPDENIVFFGSNKSELKELFLKAREDLTEENFKDFVEKREELIFNKVKHFLGF